MDLPFTDELKRFFYNDLDSQSSVYIFGSAATGNWVRGRSDFDLIIYVPEEKIKLLGDKVREWGWSSNPAFPILDGFAISKIRSGVTIKRLEDLQRVTFPSDAKIDLIDRYMIKNRSKHLFGVDCLDDLISQVTIDELRKWAKETISSLIRSNPNRVMPESEHVLSKLIWIVSWTARMLMLSRGIVCESKRESLEWLSSEYPAIREEVNLLLLDFLKSDFEPILITHEQARVLQKFCFELLFNVGS